MEKTLISWSVPNMITIWLMLFLGFAVLSICIQLGMKFTGGNAPANNSGGY